MTALPGTSPLPPLVFMPAQSSRMSSPAPTPTPAPRLARKLLAPESEPSSRSSLSKSSAFPLPKLRLEIRDLNHEGAGTFLEAVIASKALSTAVQSVLEFLYHSPDSPTTTVPPTRSVTLILRPMDGVAYTTGSDLDGDHKEIHFSLDYIHKAISPSRKTDEIMGVLTHEMVHW
jgi:Peptidase of plants and bacteria